VFIANLLSLLFWLWSDRLHSIGADGVAVNSYDAISLQISVLGIIITAMAIGLGIASVFGYQALQQSMLTRAETLVNARLDGHPLFKDGAIAGGTSQSVVVPLNEAGQVAEESAAL
jgi:hypothetical protein